ncbi:hypothetical protein C8R45DRAFT_935837 [Mycena sanguinolenta]|nr:hypothetical protein C8R45DRAFT_935837 [Mycena sanguinolenta]
MSTPQVDTSFGDFFVSAGQVGLEDLYSWRLRNGRLWIVRALERRRRMLKYIQIRTESSLFGLPNGLAPAPTGFFGLGLGFGCRSKPKPGRSACKPVCSLSRETGFHYAPPPTKWFLTTRITGLLELSFSRHRVSIAKEDPNRSKVV